ncbi:hypothetical protein F5050DRAFT_1670335, partial [Lentinula boryana]
MLLFRHDLYADSAICPPIFSNSYCFLTVLRFVNELPQSCMLTARWDYPSSLRYIIEILIPIYAGCISVFIQVK